MSGGTGKLVGIDLGTTFSAISTLDDHGNPVTIPNRDGDMLTPSAVLLLDDGTAVVGQAALDVILEQPERVAIEIKRSIGRPNYGRSEVGKEFQPLPVAGRMLRPETLSAIILRKLVQDAELRLGPISGAVITVPAYFDETRRKATKDASRIAGLQVLDMLNEPVAAALAYSFQRSSAGARSAPGAAPPMQPGEQRTVMVYDLGGGTFDVTLVNLSQNRFQTLAIEGDAMLGGKDWDARVVDYVAARFKEKHGTDPRDDAQSLANLRAAAERAKRTLSKLAQATVTCTHAGQMLTVPLSRTDFEELTRDLLVRTQWSMQLLLREAKLTWDQVDRVLLVGGSTHMPMTRQLLKELTGKEADNSLAVSEVVARGAAIHAGIMAVRAGEESPAMDSQARSQLGQVVEINVNAHSLGLEVKNQQDERVNDILVSKNTMLPISASRVYSTKAESQQRVRVKVLQGDAPQPEFCISIGECWIEGLPPSLPKGSPVQVRYAVGSDGLVDVMALDMTSGKLARTVIHRSSGLSDEEIAREAEWVRSLRIQ